MRSFIRPFYLWLISHKRLQDFCIRAYYRAQIEQWKKGVTVECMFEHGNKNRFQIYEYVNDKIAQHEAIHYLEFGVLEGHSLKWWLSNNRDPDSTFVGFDAFLGLPEDWNKSKGKGAFNKAGVAPKIDDERCRFEIGWFDETIGNYFREFERRHRLVIHCDADLYSSTMLALMHLAPMLQPGDVIMFDEFSDFMHEFRAFKDCLACVRLDYKAVCATGTFRQVAVQITRGVNEMPSHEEETRS